MFLRQIHDEALAQYAYLIGCQRTSEALLIDPERDIDRYLEIAAANDLRITAVAETHIHADFVSGSRQLLETQPEVTAYLSDMGDTDWKYEWARGRSDVRLVRNGDRFQVGNIQITIVHTPGHTPEHICFAIEDQGGGATEPVGLATGDFIFVGDVGRPDLLESAAGVAGAMEPSAHQLYHSILDFQKYPDFVQILPGHGAGSACGKALGAIPTSTAGYERRFNGAIQTALHSGENAFVREILAGQPEPPVYFARMKQVNKQGPDVLASLPAPPKLSAAQLVALSSSSNAAILDTRQDREAFMRSHLKGSLFTPLGGVHFPAVVGSYVKPDEDVYLLLFTEQELDQAVRQLVRIGIDRVRGFALLEDVLANAQDLLTQTRHEDVATLDSLVSADPNAFVLDVRRAGEYTAGHFPGAKNIAHTRLATKLNELPPDRTILVHCASGVRASFATAFLERQGFDAVHCDGSFQAAQAATTA